jgi:hypothetical protein
MFPDLPVVGLDGFAILFPPLIGLLLANFFTYRFFQKW